MTKPPISVCTTTKDSAPEIYRLLESVEPIADEIIVLDTDSTDGTIEICEKFGAKIYQHTFCGFADLKRSAIDKATNDWVFIIDSDEKVPPELREEIIQQISGNEAAAYYIKKTNVMFGERTHIEHPKRPYLAKKQAIEYRNEYMNETLSVKEGYTDQTVDLENKIIHFAYDDFGEYLTKWDQYSSLDALQAVEKDKPDLFLYYFAQGILHLGFYLFKEMAFLDGRSGVIFSFMSFQYKLVVWWKIRMVKRMKEEHPDDWKELWIDEYCQR